MPGLRQQFIVSGTENGVDICFVSPNFFWVDNGHNLIQTNTHGDVLHRVDSSHSYASNMKEMVYIDREFSIQKISYHTKERLCWLEDRCYDNQLSYTAVNQLAIYWLEWPLLFHIPITPNLFDTTMSSIWIEHLPKQRRPCSVYPRYITENINQDIFVSDVKRGRILTTNRMGEVRYFSTVDNPRGICTDRLSRILVCRYSKDIYHFSIWWDWHDFDLYQVERITRDC